MLPSEEYRRKLEQIDEDENEKLKQPVSEFPSAFACVPWGHHVRIVQHSETIEEALFYVGYTIKEGISRDTLERVMKDDIYNKRGKAPNNFPKHLTPQLAGLAQQVVKENYDFGFATVSHETYDESELEKEIGKPKLEGNQYDYYEEFDIEGGNGILALQQCQEDGDDFYMVICQIASGTSLHLITVSYKKQKEFDQIRSLLLLITCQKQEG